MKSIIFFLLLGFLAVIFPTSTFAHEISGKTTIHMTDTGFDPSEVTIKQGDTIIFENISSTGKWPASDIHPTHAIYSEFDPKEAINPGESWEFTFDKTGGWSMHDHLYSQFTGNIVVTPQDDSDIFSSNEEKEVEKVINNWQWKIRTKLAKFFYRIFPDRLEKDLKNFDSVSINPNHSADTIYWLTIAGSTKTMEQLLVDTDGGRVIDCHQQAHIIGRLAYELYGAEVFQSGDASCHSGFYHGAMEGFLREKGTQNLAGDIPGLCDQFPSSFGKFECFHGVGHGVMAMTNYDLPKALQNCQYLPDASMQSYCYGGVFMENIVAAQGIGATPGHDTKWISDDPLFPCTAIEQLPDMQYQCYLMQTSRMLTLFDYDFQKVANACLKAPKENVFTCFQSLGRDAAGVSLRNIDRTLKICSLVDKEYFGSCMQGALQVIIDFWGDKIDTQAHDFCKGLSEASFKNQCFRLVGSRYIDVFGKDANYNSYCSQAGEYSRSCTTGAESFLESL